MMIDRQNLLSDAQNLAQAAGTYLSTNTIDLGVAGTDALGNTVINDVGRGHKGELLAQVTETFTSGGAGTLAVNVVQSANADLSSATVLHGTPALALATLRAGYQFRIALPAGITQRYIGLQYVIATATMTAGKVTAGLVEAKQTNPLVA